MSDNFWPFKNHLLIRFPYEQRPSFAGRRYYILTKNFVLYHPTTTQRPIKVWHQPLPRQSGYSELWIRTRDQWGPEKKSDKVAENKFRKNSWKSWPLKLGPLPERSSGQTKYLQSSVVIRCVNNSLNLIVCVCSLTLTFRREKSEANWWVEQDKTNDDERFYNSSISNRTKRSAHK